MIHLLTIIGARPQIIKAAALNRAIRTQFPDRLQETLVHTGQHYDDNMSKVFFEEMGIPTPDVNLEVGSDTHGRQTAVMIERLETVMLEKKPEYVVVYGDTNSTLAGSITAAKLHIPVVHIEAGLRSFNKKMPEEINRIVCDHTSTLLFSPTRAGIDNLVREGFEIDASPPYSADHPGVFHCGDIMYDNSLYFSAMAEKKSSILEEHRLNKGEFVLGTVHRDQNTDDPKRLKALFEAFQVVAQEYRMDVVLPLHPRTSKMMESVLDQEFLRELMSNPRLKIIPPASYFDILQLERFCSLVMTDSGGLQKEAYYFQKPVVILRPQTEWVEIVEVGAGIVTDADRDRILSAVQHFINTDNIHFPPLFGDGHAAEFIAGKIA
jgi:UDP-GlcNAc3NAcA epimerase